MLVPSRFARRQRREVDAQRPPRQQQVEVADEEAIEVRRVADDRAREQVEPQRVPARHRPVERRLRDGLDVVVAGAEQAASPASTDSARRMPERGRIGSERVSTLEAGRRRSRRRLVPCLIMKSIGGSAPAAVSGQRRPSTTSSRKSRRGVQARAEVLADAEHAAGALDARGDEEARVGVVGRAGDPIELAAVVVEAGGRQAEAVGPADRRDRRRAAADPGPRAAPGTTGVVDATKPPPRLMPRPRKFVSDTSAPPQNAVAALVLGNSSLMTMVPRSSTSTDQDDAAAAGAARDRQPHVQEVAEREQPVARRLDARVGGVDRGPLRQAEGRQLGEDDRLLGLVVAADEHLVDHVARAEALVGERAAAAAAAALLVPARSLVVGAQVGRAQHSRRGDEEAARRIAGARGAAMRAA